MITVVDSTGTLTITSAVNIIQYPEKVKVMVRAFGTTVQIYWDDTHYVSDVYTNYTIGGVVYGSAALAAEAIAAMLNEGSGGSSPVVKKEYTVGLAGVADCDYNFTAPANATEQSIQLGATTIIPASSPVTSIVAKCNVGITGGTGTFDMGKASGDADYMPDVDLSATNAINSVSAQVVADASASSIYFSMTPSANWNTLSLGKWTITIYYNE